MLTCIICVCVCAFVKVGVDVNTGTGMSYGIRYIGIMVCWYVLRIAVLRYCGTEYGLTVLG